MRLLHSCATRTCPKNDSPENSAKKKDKRRSRREDINDHIDNVELIHEVLLIDEVVDHYREIVNHYRNKLKKSSLKICGVRRARHESRLRV